MKNIDKLIVVGDRVLIRPESDSERTKTGLYLPPGVQEKERVQAGYVLKVGPGFPIAANIDEEPWKDNKERTKYISLQAREGDYVIFLRREAVEIEFDKEKLLIIQQNALLLIVRDDF